MSPTEFISSVFALLAMLAAAEMCAQASKAHRIDDPYLDAPDEQGQTHE